MNSDLPPLFDDSPPASGTRPRPPMRVQPNTSRWIVRFGVLCSAITFALLVVLIGLLTIVRSPTPVMLVIDGDATLIHTHAPTIAALLAELNFDTNSGDRVQPPLDTPITPNLRVQIDRARSVALVVDGESRLLWTPLTNPGDVLASAGVIVSDGDVVIVDGTTARPADLASWGVPVRQITVRHVVTFSVQIDDGVPRALTTTRTTIGEALYDAGIEVYLADTLSVDLSAPVEPNLIVRIVRARPVTVIADGQVLSSRAQGDTVADALAAAGVTLVGLDYAIPAPDEPLIPGMSIRVIRVRETLENEDTPIPFETVYQADPELELDQRRVLQAGQEGIQRRQVRVRYENDIAISRQVESEGVAAEPVNEIVGYGTNVVIRTLNTPDGVISYYRHFRMYATSYRPIDGDNITATGRVLQRGIVAANPRIMPFGTQVYVPDYGFGDVQDTGGARSSPYWIDLGYTEADWRSWSRYVDVYLIAPPPANLPYMLPAWTPMRGRPDN